MFYVGGHGCVLCQFIESATFARCAFILHCGISHWADIYIHADTLILEHLRNNDNSVMFLCTCI